MAIKANVQQHISYLLFNMQNSEKIFIMSLSFTLGYFFGKTSSSLYSMDNSAFTHIYFEVINRNN